MRANAAVVFVATSLLACDEGSGDGRTAGNPDAAARADGSSSPSDAAASNVPTRTGGDGLPQAACPPWQIVDSAEPEEPTIVNGVMTVATSAVGENMYFGQGSADFVTPPTFVIEASVRLLSGAASVAHRSPADITF